MVVFKLLIMINKIKINTTSFLFLIYLLFIFFYLVIIVKPVLFYQAQQPAFLNSSDYLHQLAYYPGGLADYLSLFLMQFFYFNWLGALIIILLLWTIAFSTIILIKKLNLKPSLTFFLQFLPVIIILWLINNYNFPFSVLTRLLFVIIGLNIFQKILNKFTLKVLSYFILSIVLYCIAGSLSFLLFSLCAVILLFSSGHDIKFFIAGIIFILFAAIIPYVAYKFIFNISIVDVYHYILPGSSIMLKYHYTDNFYFLFGYLPVLLLVYAIFKTKNNSSENNFKQNKISHPYNNILSFLKKENTFIIIQFVFLIVLTSCLILSFNRSNKYVLLSDYYTEREDWDEVIKNAVTSPVYDAQITRDFNRALYHTGELTEKIFKYPQLYGSDGLFPDNIEEGEKKAIPCSDIYFDLGFIGQSQHWAFEAQTLMPYNPRILKRLIINSIIMADYKLTDKFLKVLDENFLYRNWVKRCREFISDSAKIANDEFIRIKRDLSPDSGLMYFHMDDNLYLLMKKNYKNKMAFEYLTTYYLLNQDLDNFYRIFPHTPVFGY